MTSPKHGRWWVTKGDLFWWATSQDYLETKPFLTWRAAFDHADAAARAAHTRQETTS